VEDHNRAKKLTETWLRKHDSDIRLIHDAGCD